MICLYEWEARMQRDATFGGDLVKSARNSLKHSVKIAVAGASPTQARAVGRSTMAAFALGFACVAVAIYSGGGDFNRAFARDDGGMYEFLAKNNKPIRSLFRAPVFFTPSYRAPVVYQPSPYYNPSVYTNQASPAFGEPFGLRKRSIRGFANLPHNIAPLRQRGTNQPRQLAGASDLFVDASGLPRRSYCVRLCDGFFFPVAPVSSDGDLNAHESLCAGICPGSPTRLFIMPGGSERIEDAASRDGKRYGALPVAFRHTGTTDNTCTCRPENIAYTKIVSVMKDFTMRQGDMVMTNKGFRVFRGSSHYPYGQADFMSLAESGINSKNRAALSAIESATRRSGARQADIAPVKPEKTAHAVQPGSSPPDETLVQSNGKSIRRIGPQV